MAKFKVTIEFDGHGTFRQVAQAVKEPRFRSAISNALAKYFKKERDRPFLMLDFERVTIEGEMCTEVRKYSSAD